jgi:glycosyltransferase involved in cell wall biosynthesis
MSSRFDLRGARRAYGLWRTDPDVVFTHSVDAHLVGHAIAARVKVRHVAAEHGGPGIARRPHHRLVTRLVAPRTARVVAIDDSQRPDLVRIGYREQAIRIIPNGIPEPQVRRSRKETRREVGFGDDDIVAVLVAALRPEKRADRFIDGVARAHASDGRIRGLVVGAGPGLDDANERAGATSGVVRVLGERTDVPDLMAASDVVCLSSDVEGLPMTVLEALALAKPVIASDVGGLRNAIAPGETGWLVRPDPDAFARALLELAGDRERAHAMGQAGLAVFRERYTVEHMVDRYAALLSEVVRERRTDAG